MNRFITIFFACFPLLTNAQNAGTREKIIVTQRPQTVPAGKRWVLISGEKTKVQISEGALTSGTLCNAMFLSNPQITFNINKGDYRNPETFGIIFKDLSKVPYGNDYTYYITPISIIDKDFSLSDLHDRSPETAGRREIDFDEGESVYLTNCLISIELIEIDLIKKKPAQVLSDISFCDNNSMYTIRRDGRSVSVHYSNLNNLDRSFTYKGYIVKNRIYIKVFPKKYVCEFILSDGSLLLFNNNTKRWDTIQSCNAPQTVN